MINPAKLLFYLYTLLNKQKPCCFSYSRVQTVDKVQQLLGFSTFRTVFLI